MPDVMLDLFRRQKVRAEILRMQEAQARLDILEDDWMDLLLAELYRCFKSEQIRETLPLFVSTEHNPLKRIGSELSTAYKWGATRVLRDQGQQAAADGLWEECRIDEVLASADLHTTVLRDVLLFPDVVDGQMVLFEFLPNATTVVQHPGKPWEAVSFRTEMTLANTPGYTDVHHVTGDVEKLQWFNADGKLVREEMHGMGRLPAVVIHADERTGGRFWGDTAFRDVAEACIQVGKNIFELNRITHFQSELQPTYQGRPQTIAKGITVGGEVVWAGEGEWGTLDLQADVQKILSVIKARLSWISSQHGLAPDAYDLSSNASSGFQMRLRRQPIEAARVAQLKRHRRTERELLTLMAMVSERKHPLYRLDPMRAEFKMIDFHEEPMLEDPKTQDQVWRERIELGITSEPRVLQEQNPDLSLEEAKALVLEMAREREPVIEMKKRLGGDQGLLPQQAQGRIGGLTKAANAGEKPPGEEE